MASEATKMAVRGSMHRDTKVIKVADVKSEVISRPQWPQRLLEAICTWIPG